MFFFWLDDGRIQVREAQNIEILRIRIRIHNTILGTNSQTVQQFLWMFLIHKLKKCSVPLICPLLTLLFFPMCTLCMYVGVFLSKTHSTVENNKTYDFWNLPTNRFSGIQIRKLVPIHKCLDIRRKEMCAIVLRRKIFFGGLGGVGGVGGWRCLKMGCVCLCCLV